MKKSIILIMILLSLTISGCSSTMSVKSLNIPITENMALKNTYQNKVDKTKVEISTYIISNEKLDSFLSNYEELLNEGGWTTTKDMKPYGIIIEKEDKNVAAILYEESNELLLDIIPTPKAVK